MLLIEGGGELIRLWMIEGGLIRMWMIEGGLIRMWMIEGGGGADQDASD